MKTNDETKIDDLLENLANQEDEDGNRFAIYCGERFEVELLENKIDDLKNSIGVRYGTFVEFDRNRNILPLRNDSWKAAHDGLDKKGGICRYLYARCEDWSSKQNPPWNKFHPDAVGCMIWLVPEKSTRGNERNYESCKRNVKAAQDMINSWC